MTLKPTSEFRAIYDSEVQYVCAWLRRLGVAQGDVEDVAHDVFVTVFRRLADYDRSRPIRPWISGILFRFASDYRRSARARKELLSADIQTDAQGPSVEDSLAARQDLSLVEKALLTLDPEDRLVFGLHELEDMSIADIAKAVDVNVNTLYSRVRTVRKDFMAAYKRFQLRGGGS